MSPLNSVLNKIDEINAQDPNQEMVDGKQTAKELIYGHRMSECLAEYFPDATPYLQIAVRAQHVKRWHIQRNEYPTGKAGYLNWRKALGAFHAETAANVMQECGYNENEAAQVATIVRKEKLRSNADSQTLEDVACLVFLTHYFGAFAAKHEEEKIISIVRKTWKKMSQQAQNIALTLTLPPHLTELVKKALA